MQTIHGIRCASLLLPMELPYGAMVRCLMDELDLNRGEAATAILIAQSVHSRLPSAFDE